MSIFNPGKEKRKLGHSKFDVGFNSLSTDNFGAINTKAVFETLPDDFWYIGENALTKVKPMVAPPFTRIHQNWYAFYVRNQQIWKDWNNYITNGTAWGDVYGSNVTNQNRENPWKVPQLSANDLQLPLKIANGFALPVFRVALNFTQIGDVFGTDFNSWHFTHSQNLPTNLNSVNFLARCLCEYAGFKIPYVQAYATTQNVILFEFGGSYTQLDPILSKLYTDREHLDPEPVFSVGEDLSHSVDTSSILHRFITYRLFSDSSSNTSDLSHSPFYHTKSVHNSVFNGLDLTDYDFNIRITRDDFYQLGVHPSNLSVRFVKLQSDYYGLESYVYTDNTHDYVTFTPVDYLDNSFTYSFRMSKTYTGIREGASFADDVHAYFDRLDGYLGVTTNTYFDFLDGSIPNMPDINNFDITKTSVFSAFAVNSLTDQDFHSLGPGIDSDLLLPVSVSTDEFDTSLYTMYSPFKMAPQSFLTDSMGYFSDAWLIYLCKQVARHLDNFNIPVDALTCRPTPHYRYEFYNALPFFAYSKVWNDHFRNKALSSPELDYSYTNGFDLIDVTRVNYLNSAHMRPGVLPETMQEHAGVVVDKTNGWVIPLCMLPKNSKPQDFTQIAQFRHFISSQDHYFSIESYIDVFALLTGCCLDSLVLHQQFRSFVNHFTQSGTVDYFTFSQLYASKFYLPSYYNGLLHLKYQNFNQDYFTSGLLDPMSGANQVELGNTVNELRVNETKQAWYERIVNSRSITGFFRSIFGIDPIVEDTESRMLGSDHIDINIGEVIQTSQTDVTPQGTRSGLGQAHGNGSLVHSHTNEHGWILIVCSHTIESQYMQGIERHFIPKSSYMDYPTQDFENIGNESILQKEINYDVVPTVKFRSFVGSDVLGLNDDLSISHQLSKVKYNAQGNPLLQRTSSPRGLQDSSLTRNIARTAGTSLDNVFAFNYRFSTYKFKLDQCHGEFRNRLRFWQTFRQFNSQPVLSHEFVNWELLADSEELNRIFAVTDDEYDDKFLLDVFINAIVDRALSYISLPKSK